MTPAMAVAPNDDLDDLIHRLAAAVRDKMIAQKKRNITKKEGKTSVEPTTSCSASAEQASAANAVVQQNRPSTPVFEQRQDRRRRVLMSGKITGGTRHAAIDCSIRNLNSTGACIQFDSLQQLPDRFQLFIQREGLVRDVNVVWRTSLMAGVVFSGWENKIADTDFSNRNSVLQLVKSMGVVQN